MTGKSITIAYIVYVMVGFTLSWRGEGVRNIRRGPSG